MSRTAALPALVLALLAVLVSAAPAPAAPVTETAAPGKPFALAAREASMPHGVAGDRRFVFLTEMGLPHGSGAPRVVVLDRGTGEQVAEVPPPPGGFGLPFALRVPEPGRLVVLDNSGFPPTGPPKVHEFTYDPTAERPQATLERTVRFDGLPLFFAEDVEVLDNGELVVSEAIVGAFWLVGRDGSVRPALLPSGPPPLDRVGPCGFPTGFDRVGDVPFASIGGFAPGAGTMAVRGDWLYFGQACRGGLHRVALATLRDGSRPAEERVREVETISPRPAGTVFEVLHGLAHNRWNPRDPWIYAGDPFRLRLIRVHAETGERQVVSDDERLFNFTVTAAFLPPLRGRRPNPLVTVGDQEHRYSVLNPALQRDVLRPPYLVTKLVPPPAGARP